MLRFSNNLIKITGNLRTFTCTLKTTSRLNEIFTVQDEEDFKKRVLESDKPVIIDFYANWCGPCKILAPRIESIIGANDKVHLAKINVDDNDSIAAKYEVSSIPTVIAVKNGKTVDQFVGVKDEDEIQTFVDRLLVKN